MKILRSVFKYIGKGLVQVIKSPFKLLFRIFSIKTLIIIGLVAAIIALLYFGFGLGMGNGNGDGNGDGNAVTVSIDESASNKPQNTQLSDEKSDVSDDEQFIQITIAENDYWFQNSRLSLDDLISSIQAEEFSGYKVRLHEDNASKNAYEELVNRLREEGIIYEED